MSYVVSVWEPPADLPAPSSLEEAMNQRDAMFDRPDFAEPNRRLATLGQHLNARYPGDEPGGDESGDADDSFWSDGSVLNFGTSPVWNIGIAARDRLDEVQAVLVTYATALGLHVFDDQAGEAHLADGRVFSLGPRGPCVRGIAALYLERFPIARAEFERLAAAGNAIAQRNLGEMHERGIGMPADRAQAERLYRQAAQGGDAEAATAALRLGVSRTLEKMDTGVAAMQRAAEHGSPEDQYLLGHLHEEGLHGATVDVAEASRWYRKAADRGSAQAQYALARMYALGIGVAQDSAQSTQWAEKAAAGGHIEAQFNLGVTYRDGDGVPVDFEKSLRLFAAAASRAHADATNSIGYFYRNGLCVPQDHAVAEAFFRLADRRGCKLEWVEQTTPAQAPRIERLVGELERSTDIFALMKQWRTVDDGRELSAPPIAINENRFHWGHAALLLGVVGTPLILLIQPDPVVAKNLLIASTICGFAGLLRVRKSLGYGTSPFVGLAVACLVPVVGSLVCLFALVQSLRSSFR